MTALQSFVESSLAKALAWTLVHSLWQGLGIGLVLLAALAVLRDSRTRYAAACASLLAVVAAFAATLAKMTQVGIDGAVAGALALPARPLDTAGSLNIAGSLQRAPLLSWLAPLWMLGVAGYYLFNTVSWLATRRLRGHGVCHVSAMWSSRLTELGTMVGITRAVVLLESAVIQVPAVLGWMRPVILFPVGMLTALPAGQLEAILLHELAHIRRRDYLANIIQTLAEGMLFYHPAVWWISSVIRTERENCCDDLVIAARVDRLEYATALAALEQARWPVSTVPAITGGNLMQRISRLLQPVNTTRVLPSAVPAALLTLAAALSLFAWQSQAPPPPPPPPARPVGATTADSPWTRWVNEDVAYIIRADERSAFLGLKTDAERDHFIEQFWLRRDPTPGTAANEMKEEHYRRIGVANQKFLASSGTPGWKTDRGRIYITFGPPDELESHPVAAGKPAFEAWRYRFIEGVGTNVIMEFVDTAGSGDYRMSMDPNPPTTRFANPR